MRTPPQNCPSTGGFFPSLLRIRLPTTRLDLTTLSRDSSYGHSLLQSTGKEGFIAAWWEVIDNNGDGDTRAAIFVQCCCMNLVGNVPAFEKLPGLTSIELNSATSRA